MDFMRLQCRLIAYLRERVRSGDVTERGLARLTGMSQPHVHNLLKGKRIMSMVMADQVMRTLRINLFDLLEPDDFPNTGSGV